ncbi:MAG: pyridoxamine 5'-phosphate oxidase [Geminicoccaceae bacterium]|nr:pyridoxamine 5'-phosphate oxidase [Geminicoccaceae bacterium]MDW8125824.1 pyridoxamine 5'-phosphate oxidase [Geminicoccaceae bacterium]
MSRLDTLRVDYEGSVLLEEEAAADPFDQFDLWLHEALAADFLEPNAMALATVGADGRPSVRMVLLKDFDRRGFTFYTNYESRKGRELERFPFAALLFYWDRLHRQVRIEGRIEKVAPEESDAYFAKRPYENRIAALASPQSRPIDRNELARRFLECTERYPADPPRPAFWGGYRLVPDRFEFWQGRRSRLHDRLVYTPSDAGWRIERLAP